jgi:hypothetical protein
MKHMLDLAFLLKTASVKNKESFASNQVEFSVLEHSILYLELLESLLLNKLHLFSVELQSISFTHYQKVVVILFVNPHQYNHFALIKLGYS